MLKHTGTKYLQTQRLVLRPFRAEDAESCVRNWAADPDIYRYISQQVRTPQDVSQWLSTAEQAYTSLETYYWAITEATCGDVIGEIFVDDFSNRNRWCELDWKIGKAYWGNGYAAEAATVVIRYLLDEVGFHRVQAKCSVDNSASERVMQKVGMTKEGILRDYFLGKDHRWRDVVLYSLLSSHPASPQ